MSIRRFAWLVLAYNVAVIVWGAYVRATGSGAGCGSHWPLCNGVMIPRAAETATLIEFSHRLTSGIALLAVAALLVAVWRARPPAHPARRAAAFSLIFILMEAAIGAGLVLFELVADNASMARALFMAAHLVNTFVLLAFLTLTVHWLAGETSGATRSALPPVMLGIALTGLLLSGMSGAVAALGDTLYPSPSLTSAISADLSATSHILIRLRVLHPAIAIATAVLLIITAPKTGVQCGRRRTGSVVAALAAVQLMAGFANIALLAPVWMQLMHLLLADALWIACVLLAAPALAAEGGEVFDRAHSPGHRAPAPQSAR